MADIFENIGYITWQNLDQIWDGGSGLASEASLNLLTEIVGPALQPTSASNPVVKPMWDTAAQIGLVVSAGHAKGLRVSTYLYTDESGEHGPTLDQIVAAGKVSTFVNSLKSFMDTYNLDGVCIDAEDNAEAATIQVVLSALRAVLPSGKYIDYAGRPYTSPNVPLSCAQYLRYIQNMCYDMGWGNTPNAWPQSSIEDTDAAMVMWATAGWNKKQLIQGTPLYGRTAYDTKYSPATESLQFREIIAQNANTLGMWEVVINLDYATLTSNAGNSRPFWWGSAATDREKVRRAKAAGYAGMMTFAIGYDKLNDSRSLLKAIYDEIHSGTYSKYDVNQDGVVDVLDLVAVSQHLGEKRS